MVNRIRRGNLAVDEALSVSATIVRILGKLNSKAVKVRKTWAGNGHHGAEMTGQGAGGGSGQRGAARGALQATE